MLNVTDWLNHCSALIPCQTRLCKRGATYSSLLAFEPQLENSKALKYHEISLIFLLESMADKLKMTVSEPAVSS